MLARLLTLLLLAESALGADDLRQQFLNPPDAARPWVYLMVMDGNLSREGLTADLEAMQRAGVGGFIMMEINIGYGSGPVKFMSESWRELFKHAVTEAERLGLQITLNAGPGWSGSGGPWVKPEQSMQHLVGSETKVTGPTKFDAALPQPKPRTPYFGVGTMTAELAKAWENFYRDVVVLAFPTPPGNYRIAEIDRKALYYREPYSSVVGVPPFLPAPAKFESAPAIATNQIVDLTARLTADGRLVWDVPAGDWTIMRFGRTLTGQTTRPAPAPGLGFESDKFDKAALDAHFEDFVGPLLKTLGPRQRPDVGWTMLHIDSWEMGSQNWTEKFREEFQKRRGYDLLRFLPVMSGLVVESVEVSERFLWDLRQTAQELVVENHALHLRELGQRHGFGLSIEPYDMNPCADLALGGAATVPMCEFWAKGHDYDTDYSCFEAVSIAHTLGRPIVAAESFTSQPSEAWQLYPGAMKSQADWALCTGINRIVFHRYQHQPDLNRWPGMTMGPYGVHWERTQTWWDMVPAFHQYLARCQTMLRRGLPVADILYLTGEGAPYVFRAPNSATRGNPPDRLGHNFDGCAPAVLIEQASVKNGQIVFPSGMSYRVLVLPGFETMTPALLRKIRDLAKAGATVIGTPGFKSPSLAGYPQCDAEAKELAVEISSSGKTSASQAQTPNPLAPAKWIWYPEGDPTVKAPVANRYFRRAFILDGVASAQLAATADNSFELSINGKLACAGSSFQEVYVVDVTRYLRPGTNVLSVIVNNASNEPNPAGLIASLKIQFPDKQTLVINSDRQWESAVSVDGPWSPAMELGTMGMGPWSLPSWRPKASGIYPSYESVAEVLSEMNLVPDFEADGSVRYIHRRDGDTDIYFVANRENRPQSVQCSFRVTGKRPELWDPVTGEIRSLPEFAESNGQTVVPLRFEPHQSFFILFQNGKRAPGRHNFPKIVKLQELDGPWQVTFDPKWGGPEKVAFEKLEDWSKRPEDGIRYYSGTATYRKTFKAKPAKRLYLDLGEIHNLARVTLNGRPLGVVWCAPYRVDITDAVRNGDNTLEIAVANLWPNRLIGDQSLPEDKRLTQTTWNPYTKDSPLLPSGLLGPVTLQVEQP